MKHTAGSGEVSWISGCFIWRIALNPAREIFINHRFAEKWETVVSFASHEENGHVSEWCFHDVDWQVTHGADAFEAGDSVILTLKDQGILDEDEHGQAKGLADHEDELENVNMKETEARRSS